jgi:hypothetical protein
MLAFDFLDCRERLAGSVVREQRVIRNDVSGFAARMPGRRAVAGTAAAGLHRPGRASPIPRHRGPAPATVNAVARILSPSALKPGSPVVSSTLGLLRFWSLPWPPVPTGKAFCAFRS